MDRPSSPRTGEGSGNGSGMTAPGLVEAVRIVASALHDPGLGVATMKLAIKKQPNLLSKQINKMKKYRKFKGCDAIEWMRVNFGIARDEAHWIGQVLFEWEYVTSKLQTEFLDGSFNYSFQDAEGAFDESASTTPKRVGQAVVQLLSHYSQAGRDSRPKGSFILGMTPEAREEYETRQAEKQAAHQAQTDLVSQRRESSAEASNWLGRKMRARRERKGDDRDVSIEGASPQSSPNVSERGEEGSGYVDIERSGSGIWFSGEEDTPEIRFLPMERPDGVPRIRAATADKLVEWLTLPKYSDARFRDAFMLTYRSFMSPQELLRKLLLRYMGKFSPPDPNLPEEEKEQQLQLIRIKVIMVLKHWMKEHGDDFRKENRDSGGTGDIMYELQTFITDILPLYMKPAAEQMLKTYEAWEAEYQAQKANKQAESQPDVSTQYKELNINDVDVTILAQQMCIIEHSMWRKIRPSECLNKAWSSDKKKHTTSPNILAIIKRFNMMSSWATSQVMNNVKLADRVQAIKRLLTLGKKLAEYNNFNSVMQVMAGLHSSPVARLKKTWEVINKEDEYATIMRTLEELTSHDASYKLYRTALHGSVPPCVPYLGVYLTDLTFIEDGNQNMIDGLINWHKNQMIAAVITEIRFYQTPSYTFTIVPELYGMMLEIPLIDEAAAYTISLKIEPRDTTEAIETLLMEEAKLKQQVQELQVRIADLEMQNKRLNDENASLVELVKSAHRKSYKGTSSRQESASKPSSVQPREEGKVSTLVAEQLKKSMADSSTKWEPDAQPTTAGKILNSIIPGGQQKDTPASIKREAQKVEGNGVATKSTTTNGVTPSPPAKTSTGTATAASQPVPPLASVKSVTNMKSPTSPLPSPPSSAKDANQSSLEKSPSLTDLPLLQSDSSSAASSPTLQSHGTPPPKTNFAVPLQNLATVQPVPVPEPRSGVPSPPPTPLSPSSSASSPASPSLASTGSCTSKRRPIPARPRPTAPPPPPPAATSPPSHSATGQQLPQQASVSAGAPTIGVRTFIPPLKPPQGAPSAVPPPLPPSPSTGALGATSPRIVRPVTPGRPLD